MRKAMLALLAVAAAGIGSVASSAPAAAYDYPWCVTGGELGYPGECMYETREQCLASAYGRWALYCKINPRVAFRPQQSPLEPQPRRRGRHYE
jgi:hypothetical protein